MGQELSAEQAAILALLGRIEVLEREAARLRRSLALRARLDQPCASLGAAPGMGVGMGVAPRVARQLARVRS